MCTLERSTRTGPACFVVTLTVALGIGATTAAQSPPYPDSSVIEGITFDMSTHRQEALGSDQFGTTWAADGALYTAWGDGVGFGAADYTEQSGPFRASLGVSRLDGPGDSWTAVNLWGGLSPLSTRAATLGKTDGAVIAIGDAIYLYVGEQDVWTRSELWRSTDGGMHWTNLGWILGEPDGAFSTPGIVQFGQAYAGARDEYVYGYSDQGFTNGLGLLRVRAADIENRGAYEFFAGSDGGGAPMWSSDVNDRQPVFTDPNGAEWGATCVYDAPLGRYLLAVRHNGESGEWGLFDAPEPWGPWTTVAYGGDMPGWTYTPSGASSRPTYMHTFPTKWMSADGLSLWHIFDRGDSFNTSAATLTLVEGPPPVPVSDLTVTSGAAYEWFMLASGERMYIDRAYVFGSPLPGELDGEATLRTANDDKASPASDAAFVSFTVTRDATVYVLYTSVNTSLEAAWLNDANGWTARGITVPTDLGAAEGSRLVRAKWFTSGARVELGGNGSTSDTSSMYNAVVVPAGMTTSDGGAMGGDAGTRFDGGAGDAAMPPDDATGDGGCGCVVAGARKHPAAWATGLFIAVAAASYRRRRLGQRRR